MRKISNAIVSNVSSKQIPSVLSIAEKQLGVAYIDVDDLENEGNVSLAATVSGVVAGFCTGKRMPVYDVYQTIPQLEQKRLKQFEVVKEVGIVSSIATDPHMTGHGIGDKLIASCVDGLEKQGLSTLIMTGWKTDKGVHIGSLAKKHGFKEILEIDKFWYEDSKTNNYRCPTCGEPPCCCSAVVFIKHISLN